MSQDLLNAIEDVEALVKQGFTAVPPSQAAMPPGGAPPMDPAMAQQMAMQQGAPMPPGGAPPMDPAMAQQMAAQQGAPMDPAAAAAQQGAPPPQGGGMDPDTTAMFMAMQNRLDNLEGRVNTLDELRKQRETLVGGTVRGD